MGADLKLGLNTGYWAGGPPPGALEAVAEAAGAGGDGVGLVGGGGGPGFDQGEVVGVVDLLKELEVEGAGFLEGIEAELGEEADGVRGELGHGVDVDDGDEGGGRRLGAGGLGPEQSEQEDKELEEQGPGVAHGVMLWQREGWLSIPMMRVWSRTTDGGPSRRLFLG